MTHDEICKLCPRAGKKTEKEDWYCHLLKIWLYERNFKTDDFELKIKKKCLSSLEHQVLEIKTRKEKR